VSLAVILTVFPVIFIGELPDKTMFASLVLATRGRAGAVWIGTAAAFLVHTVLSVTVGVAVFRFLPHRVVGAGVALLFFLGAAYALWEIRKAQLEAREEREEELIEREARTHRQVVTTAFAVIFLAEWGDLTQILTVNLAAHYHDVLSVGIGALRMVAGIAVVGGQGILRFVRVATIRWFTAVILTALGVWAAWSVLR
jgi:putative Ca2+/H+ antiporter (TMEM165/GDT1 family)